MSDVASRERPRTAISHLYAIDIVRFSAACLVALFHLSWQFAPASSIPPVGWIGVQIFFVISGYVIAGSMMGSSPAEFAKKRFLRLYPAGWICTAINVIILLMMPGYHNQVGVFASLDPAAVLSSFALFGSRFVGSAYWTLPIEISFYLLVVLALWLRLTNHVQTLCRVIVVSNLCYIPLLVLHQGGYVALSFLESGYGLKNTLLMRHGVYFALGIILWRASHNYSFAHLGSWVCISIVTCAIEI